MPHPQFDRRRVKMRPLADRENHRVIERDRIALDREPLPLGGEQAERMAWVVSRVKAAAAQDAPVMLSYGAHTIKNGLAPVVKWLIEEGWLAHVATNGAGIIHDWEFAWQGKSSEDVAHYAALGQFGNWQETGYYINLAINVGAQRGLGYGESVGAFIAEDGLDIPGEDELAREIELHADSDPSKVAAAADLLAVVRAFGLKPGRLAIPHAWKSYSVQAAAFTAGIPSTGHPMFGHDIIYNHPMNNGALLGRAAERDFLSFAHSVSRLSGGVYLSLGSAVMSPMVFEKSMSIARNVAIQNGGNIEGHFIGVVDLASADWDWSQGEPPQANPAYYQRYNKTFSRMGGSMCYLSMDNRDFLLHLYRGLKED